MIVTTEIDAQGIATVTLNRPEKRNAMSLEMFEALPEAAQDVSGARAVILTGAGGAFCAGLDLAVMMSFAGRIDDAKAQMADHDAAGANVFQRPCTCWAAIEAPVIAAIDGVCFGAGLQLALGADLRIAAPDARICLMEAKWGLIPDMGITQSLPKLLPADHAKLLMMTGKELSGTEAAAHGLVTELADAPMARARALAETLASKSPDAVAASKRLVEDSWPSPGPAGLAQEAALQSALLGSPNQLEAVMANMQKRPPKFG